MHPINANPGSRRSPREITAIRERSHWNSANISPQNPVGLGLCSGEELEKALQIARSKIGKTTSSVGAATAPDGVLGGAREEDETT